MAGSTNTGGEIYRAINNLHIEIAELNKAIALLKEDSSYRSSNLNIPIKLLQTQLGIYTSELRKLMDTQYKEAINA